eukprot:g28322.t1
MGTQMFRPLSAQDMTALQQALKSPQSNAIQTEAREILSKLGRACEVLREVDRLQEEYCRLEPLFRMKVLGDDEASARAVEKFGTSDEVWRLLMHRAQSSCKTDGATHATTHRAASLPVDDATLTGSPPRHSSPNGRTVLHFTGQSTVSKQLQRIWDGVKIAKEAVEKILDLRRRQSPRLWFVTDATLTEALSSAQNLSRGAWRNLNGDVMSVHGVFNYQKPAVERTLVRNGKLYTHRDLRGSDDKIYGAQWSNEEVVVRNARLEELSANRRKTA